LHPVPWRLIGQRMHTRTAQRCGADLSPGNDVVGTHVRRFAAVKGGRHRHALARWSSCRRGCVAVQWV